MDAQKAGNHQHCPSNTKLCDIAGPKESDAAQSGENDRVDQSELEYPTEPLPNDFKRWGGLVEINPSISRNDTQPLQVKEPDLKRGSDRKHPHCIQPRPCHHEDSSKAEQSEHIPRRNEPIECALRAGKER
jgi:hypothetical protein